MGKHRQWVKSHGRSGPAYQTVKQLADLRNSAQYAAGELVAEGAELAFALMSNVNRDDQMGISRRALASLCHRAAERLPDDVAPFWEPQGELNMAYEGLSRAFDQVKTTPTVNPQQ